MPDLIVDSYEPSYTTKPLYPYSHKSKIKPVFNIVGYLSTHTKKPHNQIVEEARSIFLDWLRRKGTVPPKAYAGDSFTELPNPRYGNAASCCISLEDVWGIQVIDDDTGVAGRKWTTELYLEFNLERVKATIRQTVTLQASDTEYLIPGLPSFVQEIAERIGFSDDNELFEPEHIEFNEDNLDQFYSLLNDSKRSRPILAVTVDHNTQKPLVDLKLLSRKCLGMAHVVSLSPKACWRLSETLGDEFTVHSGGIRTYQPKFSMDLDEPYDHPLLVAQKIKHYSSEKYKHKIEDMLIDQLSKSCTSSLLKSRELLSFSELRSRKRYRDKQNLENTLASKNNSFSLEDVQDLEKQFEEELKAISEEKEYYLDLADTAEKEKESIQKKLTEKEYEYNALLTEHQKLSKQMQSLRPLDYPKNVNDIGMWYRKNLERKITLLPRALKGLKKAQFENAELVCKTLELLANDYPKMKCGTLDGKIFQKKLKELELEDTQTFASEGDYQRFGEEYRVEWQGGKKNLERHLKKGVSKDQRHCLRIYYFWCDETEQVVVGWLPSHLKTDQT